MPDILHLLKIQALPERVYQALTTAQGIRDWWTRDADLDSQIGGAGEFRFYQGRVVATVKIDELEPPARVAWMTVACSLPSWDGTKITFDLRRDGSDTVIRFAHRGFEQAGDDYASTTTGWGYYLLSLRRYLETGEGAPHPNDDFARVTC